MKQPFDGKIRVLERLKVLIPPMDADAKRLLETSILAEGRAHSSLWLWGDILVDGHHRFEICERHKLPYTTVQVYESASTIEDVEYRMKREAIGQRNLPTAIQSKFRAEMVSYQMRAGKTQAEAVKAVAKDSNVTQRQVQRDVQRGELVETLEDSAKPVADTMSLRAVKNLAELPKKEQKKAVKESGGDSKQLAKVAKKKLTENQSPEDAAKKLKSLAHQHRDKLAVLICDYGNIKQNRSEQTRLVKLVQSVQLW